MHIGAERVGDTALLYVAHVHLEGPARQAGIKHGDEVVTVNGAPVTGKTYDEVIQMVRGEAGTDVKLGVRRGAEVREIAITRVASEMLFKRYHVAAENSFDNHTPHECCITQTRVFNLPRIWQYPMARPLVGCRLASKLFWPDQKMSQERSHFKQELKT
jgi:C-terminal processing protease CtpA/Prc